MIKEMVLWLWKNFKSHITNSSAHHTKYTDAEAVSAADASDKFLERNVENIITNVTTLKKETTGTVYKLHVETSGFILGGTPLSLEAEHKTRTYQNILSTVYFPIVELVGTDITKTIGSFQFVKNAGSLNTTLNVYLVDAAGNAVSFFTFEHDKIDLKNTVIKDMKNHSASALSGTKKVVEILIGTTPYYFEVYPTKA